MAGDVSHYIHNLGGILLIPLFTACQGPFVVLQAIGFAPHAEPTTLPKELSASSVVRPGDIIGYMPKNHFFLTMANWPSLWNSHTEDLVVSLVVEEDMLRAQCVMWCRYLASQRWVVAKLHLLNLQECSKDLCCMQSDSHNKDSWGLRDWRQALLSDLPKHCIGFEQGWKWGTHDK